MTDLTRFAETLEEIRAAGLYKLERIITTPQNVEIRVAGGSDGNQIRGHGSSPIRISRDIV